MLDDEGDAGHVVLIGGDDEGVGGFGLAGVDGVAALGVEVFEDDLREGRGHLEGGEDAGLGVVGVVAHGPHRRLCRVGMGRYHWRLVTSPPAPPPPPLSSGLDSGMKRCMVVAPPLPMISYMRIMPLWLADMMAT